MSVLVLLIVFSWKIIKKSKIIPFSPDRSKYPFVPGFGTKDTCV